MKQNKIYENKSLRLKEYDYSYPGAYFVTICVNDRRCVFGDVINGKMALNELGIIADKHLIDIPNHFDNTEIAEHVVMPNHVHEIVNIYESDVEMVDRADKMVGDEYICHLQGGKSQTGVPRRRQNQKLPVIIGTYKAVVSREINKLYAGVKFKWQRYYHDHVIRTERALENIYNYIFYNPYNWQMDLENKEYLKTLSAKERETKVKEFYKNIAK